MTNKENGSDTGQVARSIGAPQTRGIKSTQTQSHHGVAAAVIAIFGDRLLQVSHRPANECAHCEPERSLPVFKSRHWIRPGPDRGTNRAGKVFEEAKRFAGLRRQRETISLRWVKETSQPAYISAQPAEAQPGAVRRRDGRLLAVGQLPFIKREVDAGPDGQG